MPDFKINWKVLSPIETELQSDTIFGHLCWAIFYEDSEEKLKDFLLELEKKPIFVLSSAFPKGYLPFPNTLPVANIELKQLQSALGFSDKKEDEVNFSRLKKVLKKTHWISDNYWLKNNGSFSLPGVYLDACNKAKDIDDFYYKQNILQISPLNPKTISITHSTINRLTGTTSKEGANLYDESTTFFKEDSQFESYLNTEYFTKDELEKYFNFIQECGFGKNKNTGKGHFEITIEEYKPPIVEKPNAYLVLSNCVPCKVDPEEVYYNGFTKFGKLGGSYATKESPFKYPIFMFKPGSVFISEKPPKGTLLKNVHPKPELNIVHNAYCYSIPFHWEGGENG